MRELSPSECVFVIYFQAIACVAHPKHEGEFVSLPEKNEFAELARPIYYYMGVCSSRLYCESCGSPHIGFDTFSYSTW